MAERSVLVVGSGAREHALAWALRRSPSVGALAVAPGNPGTAEIAENVPIKPDDLDGLIALARARRFDLVVVGPEAPLAAGLADRLLAEGLRVFGPTRAAAEVEWSKAFAKEFLRRQGIPTADYRTFADPSAALDYVATARYPLVVKADGLAAGKGVTVCVSRDQAERAVRAAMIEGVFGAAGRRVVIEEYLEGEEASVIALVDGERLAVLPPARDYKRLGEGDQGPNTGGMGSYAPAPLAPDRLAEIERTILRPTVDGLRALGRPYRGALYAGLMLTPAGPQVLEFNSRFGDPEAQAILPLLTGDFAELLIACAEERLEPARVGVGPGAAVCVVLASEGYPGPSPLGRPIAGLAEAAASGALLFHAGTARRDSTIVTAGGRVLSVVGLGRDLAEATERAYAAAELVHFEGRQLRRDLGARARAAAQLRPDEGGRRASVGV